MTATIEYKRRWALPKLTARQIVNLADEIQAERRARVIAEANALNLEGDEKRRVIGDVERDRLLAGDVLLWAFTARGTMRVIEESVKALGNGVKVDDLELDLAIDYQLAVRLLGVEPVEVKPQEESAETDPTSLRVPGGT